jgi:hypothetical protein
VTLHVGYYFAGRLAFLDRQQDATFSAHALCDPCTAMFALPRTSFIGGVIGLPALLPTIMSTDLYNRVSERIAMLLGSSEDQVSRTLSEPCKEHSDIQPVLFMYPPLCNFSSTLYPQSYWCVIQVIYNIYNNI